MILFLCIMNKFENISDGGLHELPYPSELRSDHASITYIDNVGNTYLEPISEHDYEFSRALTANNLSRARLVELPEQKGILLKYGPETDLLPLASLLNSSLDHDESLPDVTLALELVVLLLKRSKHLLDKLPELPIMSMFAIDKATGSAELLAPFRADTAGSSLAKSIDDFQKDLLAKCESRIEYDRLERCFRDAVDRVGITDGEA